MAVETQPQEPAARGRQRPAVAIAALALTSLALAAAPAAASADTIASANWSGYAAHKTGVGFRAASGAWTQPTASCTKGQQTYSAFWVGIGGYSTSSNDLEQIGTELDCTASGHSSSSAWFELVPAPARTIKMTVKPGDHMTASVTVSGRQVTLRLTDATRHESFSKRVTVSSVDVSSAEWIAEAPSACTSANFCVPLPLTNFGSMRFTSAKATTTKGRQGSISSPAWGSTAIVLAPGARRFIAYGAASDSTPSGLTAAGSSFGVRYSRSTVAPAPAPSMAKDVSASASVKPGGTRN